MTPSPLLYSPWHALGLSALQRYTADEIKKAERRASLHCHPDKRSPFGINPHRWPTIDHVKESAAYLLGLLDNAFPGLLPPPNDLGDFPRTFHPSQPLGSPEEYSPCEKAGFVACETCCMVVRTRAENEHLSSHQLHRCLCCQTLLATEDCASHYQTCDRRCQCLQLEGHGPEHIAHQHICPYCHEYCDKRESLPKHIQILHACQCPDAEKDGLDFHIRDAHICCNRYYPDLNQHHRKQHARECCPAEPDEFTRHVDSHHRCSDCFVFTLDLNQHIDGHHACPHCDNYYSSMAEHIESDHQCHYCHAVCVDPEKHMLSDHKCPFCPDRVFGDLTAHKEEKHYCAKCEIDVAHLQSHLRKHCPFCSFHSRDYRLLQDHLESNHELRYCRDCSASPDHKAQFLKHILTHQWDDCPICDLRVDGGNLHRHLEKQHMWKKCESCPDPTSASAKDHFRNFHAEQSCDFCSLGFYEAGMDKHLVEVHGWEECPHCSAINEKNAMASHLQDIHKLRPCPECPEHHPATAMAAHLRVAHRWKHCSFCHHIDADQRLKGHIEDFHAICEVCGERTAKVDLPQHQIDSHAWERCPHCSDPHPHSAIEAHILGHRLRQCPQLGCQKDIPEDQFPSHMNTAHAERLCLFCGQGVTDLWTHMASHTFDAGQRSKCHHCGEEIEQTDLLSHVFSHPRTERLEGGATGRDKNEPSIQHRACQERIAKLERFIQIFSVEASGLLDQDHNRGASLARPAQASREPSPPRDSNRSQEKSKTTKPCENSTGKSVHCSICGEPRDRSNIARHRKTCEKKSRADAIRTQSEGPATKRPRRE